jgi:glycosyltransferase involved in cell wall biosynthesis
MKHTPGNRPLVTVILPVRNGEAYLAEALQSVFAQDYEPLQVIVVDGHSQDRSAEIARSFAHVEVLSQEGRGLPNAWNQSLASARGEFVAFLGHDDRWGPGKLTAQVDYLLSHPDVAITHTWCRFVLQPGCEPPAGFRLGALETVHKGRLMETLVARRGVFEHVGTFDERYHVAPDMDWFARAGDLGVRAEILPEVLLEKGVHTNNTMNQIDASNANLLTLLRASTARKRSAGREAPAERKHHHDRATAPVSVVIPLYNAERYVGEAIESVLAQTVAVAEVIVVDDGSTDRGPDIARRYGPPVRCETLSHAGCGEARNRGVELSRSEWLAFLDADDLWTPAKLERQLEAFREDPSLDMVFGHVQQFRSPELEQTPIKFEIAAGVHPGAMLIRRDAFMRVGRFSNAVVAEFFEWFGRAQDAGLRFRMLPDVFMKRRIHATNTVRQLRQEVTSDYAHVLKKMLDRRRQQPKAAPEE